MRLRPRRLLENPGQALIEYALILALASLAIVSVLIILQRRLGGTMLGTGRRLDAATTGVADQARPGEPVGGETGTAGPAPSEVDGTGHPDGHGKGKSNNGGDYGDGGPNGSK